MHKFTIFTQNITLFIKLKPMIVKAYDLPR